MAKETYTTEMRARNALWRVYDEAVERSRKLRKNGRRCCANEMLHFSRFVEETRARVEEEVKK